MGNVTWVQICYTDSTCQTGQCCTFNFMKLQTTYYFSSFSELANTSKSIKSWLTLFPLIISHIPYSNSAHNWGGEGTLNQQTSITKSAVLSMKQQEIIKNV